MEMQAEELGSMLLPGIRTCIGCVPEPFRVRPHQNITSKLNFLLKNGCYVMSSRLPEAYHLWTSLQLPTSPPLIPTSCLYGVQRVRWAYLIPYWSCRRESNPALVSLTSSRVRESVGGGGAFWRLPYLADLCPISSHFLIIIILFILVHFVYFRFHHSFVYL